VTRVSEQEIAETVGRLVRFYGAIHQLNCAMPHGPHELSPHQVRMVMHLVQHPRRTLSELAEALGISVGWASRVVDELEASGKVSRERGEDDRRVVRVSLSPHVQSLAEAVYTQRSRVVADALAALEPAERAGVASFLDRLAGGMEALAAGD